jgi:hypothetical protein
MNVSWEYAVPFLDACGHQMSIFVDGIRQDRVLAFNVKAGTCTRYVLDAYGRPQVDPRNPERAWVETVSGKVRVEFDRVE